MAKETPKHTFANFRKFIIHYSEGIIHAGQSGQSRQNFRIALGDGQDTHSGSVYGHSSSRAQMTFLDSLRATGDKRTTDDKLGGKPTNPSHLIRGMELNYDNYRVSGKGWVSVTKKKLATRFLSRFPQSGDLFFISLHQR